MESKADLVAEPTLDDDVDNMYDYFTKQKEG